MRAGALGKKDILIMSCLGLLFLVLVSLKYSHHKDDGISLPLQHIGEYIVVPESSKLRSLLKIQTVTERKVSIPITVAANVDADPLNLVKILPPVIGKVLSIYKDIGDDVERDEVLFTMESSEYALAKSDLEKANAALIYAKQTLDRQSKLITANISAKQDKELAINNFNQAQSEYQRALARLQLLQKDPNNHNEDILYVRSPQHGTITDLSIANGQFLNDPTQAVITVTNLKHVHVNAYAKQKDLDKFYIGQIVDIEAIPYTEMIRSEVIHVSNVLQADSRSMYVTAIIENKTGKLKPNMYAKAIFYSKPQSAIVIPINAVIQRGFASVVFIETAPWKFQAREVSLGHQFGNDVIVLSGLKPDEKIVVKEGIVLND